MIEKTIEDLEEKVEELEREKRQLTLALERVEQEKETWKGRWYRACTVAFDQYKIDLTRISFD